jgi:hypothetical protein
MAKCDNCDSGRATFPGGSCDKCRAKDDQVERRVERFKNLYRLISRTNENLPQAVKWFRGLTIKKQIQTLDSLKRATT